MSSSNDSSDDEWNQIINKIKSTLKKSEKKTEGSHDCSERLLSTLHSLHLDSTCDISDHESNEISDHESNEVSDHGESNEVSDHGESNEVSDHGESNEISDHESNEVSDHGESNEISDHDESIVMVKKKRNRLKIDSEDEDEVSETAKDGSETDENEVSETAKDESETDDEETELLTDVPSCATDEDQDQDRACGQISPDLDTDGELYHDSDSGSDSDSDPSEADESVLDEENVNAMSDRSPLKDITNDCLSSSLSTLNSSKNRSNSCDESGQENVDPSTDSKLSTTSDSESSHDSSREEWNVLLSPKKPLRQKVGEFDTKKPLKQKVGEFDTKKPLKQKVGEFDTKKSLEQKVGEFDAKKPEDEPTRTGGRKKPQVSLSPSPSFNREGVKSDVKGRGESVERSSRKEREEKRSSRKEREGSEKRSSRKERETSEKRSSNHGIDFALDEPVPVHLYTATRNKSLTRLFTNLDQDFFSSELSKVPVDVAWSNKLTKTAGLFKGRRRPSPEAPSSVRLEGNIALSSRLLLQRKAIDLVQTLLHEMIHAYLFVKGERDKSPHGLNFKHHMDRINSMTGFQITIFHSFHQEVNSTKVFVWRCTGPCRSRKEFMYGYLKRANNRTPSPSDFFWKNHAIFCNGSFQRVFPGSDSYDFAINCIK